MTSADMYYTLCILSELPYLDYLVVLQQLNIILIIGTVRCPYLKLGKSNIVSFDISMYVYYNGILALSALKCLNHDWIKTEAIDAEANK